MTNRSARKPTVWTSPMLFKLATLTEHGRSEEQIANRLNTSPHMVRTMRVRAGITPVTRQAFTVASAARLVGVDGKAIRRWIASDWLGAKRLQLRRGKHRQWMIKEPDLYAFLEDSGHWHRWEPERIADPDLREWAISIRSGVRFLTASQAAHMACVQPSTVNDWIRERGLPSRRNGNHLIRESDLRDWMAARSIEVLC